MRVCVLNRFPRQSNNSRTVGEVREPPYTLFDSESL